MRLRSEKQYEKNTMKSGAALAAPAPAALYWIDLLKKKSNFQQNLEFYV